MKRIAAVSASVTLSLGGVVAVAPAAHASPQSCFYFVLEHSPDTDPDVIAAACEAGAPGGEDAFRECYKLLRTDYVRPVIARDACRLAAE